MTKETKPEVTEEPKPETAESKAAKKKAEEKAKMKAKDKADAEKFAKLSPVKQREIILKNRLRSSTVYPKETRQAMLLELRAIERKTWQPGWKPPKRKTAMEKMLDD